MQLFHGTKIDFMKWRLHFFIFSITLTTLSLLFTLVIGVEYGIEFTGGTELALKFDGKQIQTDQIRKSLDKTGFTGIEIKSFGEANQFLVRMKEHGTATDKVMGELKKDFPDNKAELKSSNNIGPKIGKETRNIGLLAVVLAIVAMLLYIAFRFQFIYGLGAIVAIVHDVLITLGVVVIVHKLGLINLEFNQGLIAAFLTIVGYSVNDTVIVFDRVRENLVKHKGLHFIKLINLSINETLSRTINTVLTVVLVLVSMVILAGPVLQGFAFTMLVGVMFGTYSSVYIASAFVVWYLKYVKKVDVEDAPAHKAIAAATASANV